METLGTNLDRLDSAIELCLTNKLVLPALTLLYAGMDIVGSLERRPGEGTRASFERWVDSYLLRAQPLGCTGLELYAARCAVLHTFTADSDLSRSAKARRVFYAWGSGRTSDLQAAIDRTNTRDAVAVHVEDLHHGFRAGVMAWLQEVFSDEARARRVESAAGAWLGDLDKDLLSAFLAKPPTGAV